MNKDLVKEITFEIDEKKKLGTMRIDWYGGNWNEKIKQRKVF